jgi:hypothetical protein
MNKSLRILEHSEQAPVQMHQIRYHLNAHPKDSDEYLNQICAAACEIAASKTGQSILFGRWELIHERDDIILDHPPIRELLKVELKFKRKWVSLDLSKLSRPEEEQDLEISYMNNGAQRIKILNWFTNQKVRITYTAGYKLGEHKLPPSLLQYVLNLCVPLYGRKEIISDRMQDSLLNSVLGAIPTQADHLGASWSFF